MVIPRFNNINSTVAKILKCPEDVPVIVEG
jgi:hypothetical protein